MRVLIFEDNDEKFRAIETVITQVGGDHQLVVRAKSLGEGLMSLKNDFDLFVIDLWMPYVDGGDAVDVTKEIVTLIGQKGRISVPIMAITGFADEADRHRTYLAGKGVHIYDFHDQDVWRQAIAVLMKQARDHHRYDFLVFTALDEERRAFLSLEGFRHRSVTRAGLDFWDFDWRGRRGSVVLFPRMGLVTAAIATARVLENYSPKIVCMSGICGGVGDEAALGQLLITEICWEYQSGKWTDDAFKAEPYQIEIPESLKIVISKFIEGENVAQTLEEHFSDGDRPSRLSNPRLAIFATGSAVIASKQRLENLREQQRKVTGIDMEIYGFHRAVKMCGENTICFSAKVVVDKADVAKSDLLHRYGSFVSAKFCLNLISHLLDSTSSA